MSQPESLHLCRTGEFSGLMEQHVATFDRTREHFRITIHAFADEEVGAVDEGRELRRRTGVGNEGDGNAAARWTKDIVWCDHAAIDLNGFAILEASPVQNRDAERTRSLRIEAASARPVEGVGQARNAMRDGEGAKMESSRQVEFSWTGEFEDFDRKWKHRDDRTQCGDDTSCSLWADNAHRFLALGKGEGEQDARKSSDVVGVEVSEQNGVKITEAPAGVAPGDLGPFAAVDEDRVALAAYQER